MILILLRITATMMASLLLLKGIVSILTNRSTKFLDRFGINLIETYKPVGIGWLLFVVLLVVECWAECWEFAYSTKDSYYAGFAVYILWVWCTVVALVAPKLAGIKKWQYCLLVASVIMAITTITVFTIL